MFKVNNKDTRMTPSGVFIVNFEHLTPCSSVSIVNFQHVNPDWEDVRRTYFDCNMVLANFKP